MSDLLPPADVLECPPGLASAPVLESYPARQAALPGGLIVRRALPRAARRLVGPWCFLDHYGPLAFGVGAPMNIGPHPHIGLQTVTWLIEGEALHRDSLGTERLIRPGQLNLMTAGSGISHSEETPTRNSGRLHGLQQFFPMQHFEFRRDCRKGVDRATASPAFSDRALHEILRTRAPI